jgi:GAF domain-containing protein
VITVSGVVGRDAVDEIDSRLARVRGSDARVVVVDLNSSPRCDCRILKVLDDTRRDLAARGAVLHVRGLTAGSFTGFAESSLSEVLDAYRASLEVSEPTGPWEPAGTSTETVRNTNVRELVRACTELASAPATGIHDRPTSTRAGAVGIADRLIDQCLRHIAVSAAAVILRDPSGRPSVVSSSDNRARLLEAGGVVCGEGPAAECLRRGEPVCSPDLDRLPGRWSIYTTTAHRYGFAAARGLPIRPPATLRVGAGARTVGALSLLSETTGPMAAADLAVAQGFADLAAIAFATAESRPARADDAPREPTQTVIVGMLEHVVIEQAKGVLAVVAGLTIVEAEAQLRRTALREHISVGAAAQALIDCHLPAARVAAGHAPRQAVTGESPPPGGRVVSSVPVALP